MQDEIHDKSVALTIKVGKAVGRLKWAMLQGADNMPGKWQMLIFLGQHTILNIQKNGTAQTERSC